MSTGRPAAKGASKPPAPKNISVFLRIRPMIGRELRAKVTCNNLIADPSDDRKVTATRRDGSKNISNEYLFNKVWKPSVSQKTVYEDFGKNAVDAAFDGQHGVLFVYGQTGSGKTFTISNEDPEALGVLQQAMRDAWDRIAADREYEYQCSVSYVQLYNELLTNMLDKKEGKVRIQLGPEGRGDVVLVDETSGVTIERQVKNYNETMACFKEGVERKHMKQTKMNDTSSRSHTVFTFNVTRSKKVTTIAVNGNEQNEATRSLEGRIVLCDLAGSERISRTGAEGETFLEATHINGSLLVLGRVVNALTEKTPQHAPFRESKLTRILQYSLLGNGNTSLVINVSPADDSSDETLNSIRFGQRAIRIKQDAKRHETLDYKVLYMQLLAELDQRTDQTLENALEEERRASSDVINALREEVRSLKAENELLRSENASLRDGGDGGGGGGGAGGVSGGGGGGGAGGKGGARGGGKGTDTAPQWLEMNNELRQTIATRDQHIVEINNERVRLALLLAEERRTAFKLAEKMRALALRYQMERTQWSQRVDDLGSELAKTKGTDYLSTTGGGGSVDDIATARLEPGTGRGGEGYLQDQLDKAFRQINALRQERAEMLATQSQAGKAIRLLHSELSEYKKNSGAK